MEEYQDVEKRGMRFLRDYYIVLHSDKAVGKEA
jgi:hypothetical protein